MTKFPAQFADLLTREGRRVLDGKHAQSGFLATGRSRFVSGQGWLDRSKSKAMLALLDETLTPHLFTMEQEIPRSATWGMKVAYKERLPKSVRVRTAMLDEDDSPALAAAEKAGLIKFLRSSSFHAFAEALSGYPLRKQWGLQALCYLPGDYTGPHNDHHPDEPLGRDGYTDLHLTFANDAVEHQWLVYEQKQHLDQIQSINALGGVTCYRLPFWHYTTPLVAKPKREKRAQRWVLLGTFLDQWD